MEEEVHYRNPVVESGNFLIVHLTMGKVAILDNNEISRAILKNYHFHAIKRNQNFYAVGESMATGKNYLHRLVLGLNAVGMNVCAVDGNLLNCCRSNLILKTTLEILDDIRNQESPFKGVHKRKNGWVVVYIDSENKRRHKAFTASKFGNSMYAAYSYAVNFRNRTKYK
jgi:hypothetical protein